MSLMEVRLRIDNQHQTQEAECVVGRFGINIKADALTMVQTILTHINGFVDIDRERVADATRLSLLNVVRLTA